MGAPNLTDGIWLHGWGADAIIKMINEGKNNAMPGQARLLNEAQIHLLASYVLSKSAKAGN
jgi:cytochrome c oxidase cbb3-type subunit 3